MDTQRTTLLVDKMKRFKNFIAENTLHVFDIDETLFHTTAKIKVIHKGKEVAALSNSEYNTHKLQKDHSYDYSEFRSSAKFHDEAKPIHKMLNKLKTTHEKVKTDPNSKIILNTAREDFDDKDTFLNAFRKHGVDIDDIHVHRSGNIKDPNLSVAEKKTKIIDNHLSTGNFKHATLHDDSIENLKHFLNLKNKHPSVNFRAYHVKPDGTAHHFTESVNENITHSYIEYHLLNGKKVILQNPSEHPTKNIISGKQIKSRTNVDTVYGTKDAITKYHIIGKSAVKKQITLIHDKTYDELVERVET